MSTQDEKAALASSSSMPSSDDISLGKPEDLGQAPSQQQPQPKPSDPHHLPTTDSLDVRQSFGSITHAISDVINEHIIAARYATFATVILLGAYGAAKTPFFFRYKTVSEIPAECFAKRQTIHGRIVHIVDSGRNSVNYDSNVEKPVICLVRHLSPVGRLLSKSAFEFSLRNSPSVRLGGKIEDSRDLLKVEIAGIKEPPFYRSAGGLEQPGEFLLNRLASKRTTVACTLMAKRVDKIQSKEGERTNKQQSVSANTEFENSESHLNDRAICQLRYRPGLFSVFRQDLASTLVASGRAGVLSSGIHVDNALTSVIDGSTELENLQADVKYLEQLGYDEFEAVKENRGMWNDPLVRKERSDLVEEAEFEQTASIGKKIWRWIRERAGK